MDKRTVLIVEDDHDLRGLYRTALMIAGFDVKEAGDGLEALRRIDETPPSAVVLDLMLPRISGFGVLYDLTHQAHTRGVPVIVVTGTDEAVDQYPVACVLRKPVSPDHLVGTVRRHLEAAGVS